MANWSEAISYYDELSAGTPNLATLARWLRHNQEHLSDCHDSISHGVLHIYRNGRPEAHIRVSNCSVKEYLEISYVTTWRVGQTTHRRVESVHDLHSSIPPFLDDMLSRLLANG